MELLAGDGKLLEIYWTFYEHKPQIFSQIDLMMDLKKKKKKALLIIDTLVHKGAVQSF